MDDKLRDTIKYLQSWSNELNHVGTAFESYETARKNWELHNPEESGEFMDSGIFAKLDSQYLEFKIHTEEGLEEELNSIVKINLFTKDEEEVWQDNMRPIGNYLAVFNLEGELVDDYLIIE